MHHRFIMVVFLIFFAVINSYGQRSRIQGRVVDSDNKNDISDVNIWIEDTLIGATTDEKGKFFINIPQRTDSMVLVFSHISYRQHKKIVAAGVSKNNVIELDRAVEQLSEFVFTVNKNTHSPLEQTTIPMMLSKEAITESVTQNIPEILNKQPGVSLAGQAYYAAPSIRGLARKRVVVMVDGEKVSSERNTGASATFINPFEIDKIEIFKGPYSTLYGSDAIGGVINIIPKKFEHPFYFDKIGGRLDASYKSVNEGRNINLAINGKAKKMFYHLNAGYRDATDTRIPDEDKLMNSFFEEKHIGGKVIYSIDKKNQLTIKSSYSKGGPIGKPGYDIFTDAVHDYDNHFISGIEYQLMNISKYLSKAKLKFSRHMHEIGSVVAKHKLGVNPDDDKLVDNRKELSGVDYTVLFDTHLTINDQFKILTGFDGYFRKNIDIEEQKVVTNYNSGIFMMSSSDILLSDASQDSYGVFVQADYLLTSDLFINGGMRWNYITTEYQSKSGNGTNNSSFSGNMGLSYNLYEQFNIKANVGSAFRAPDIKEMYISTTTPGGLNIGNPDLVPEQSLNFDLAFTYNNEMNLTQLSLFHNRINDMIILDWDNNSANREGIFKNIGEGLLYGVEFSINQKITRKFSTYLNLTKIYGFDSATNDELMDVPPFQLNSGVAYNFDNQLRLKFSGRYSARQSDVAEDDSITESFTTFDFSAGYTLAENIKVNFSVANIFNEKYREHQQFEWMHAPARSVNVGMNFNF